MMLLYQNKLSRNFPDKCSMEPDSLCILLPINNSYKYFSSLINCNQFPFPALVGTLVVSCSYSYGIIIVWVYVLVVLMSLALIFPQ
jgi:hypothetical protein